MIICAIGGTEIILLCIVALLVFGGKKIPELMKGLGQGVRSFKKGMSEEEEKPVSPEEQYKERERLKAQIIREKEREEELQKNKDRVHDNQPKGNTE